MSLSLSMTPSDAARMALSRLPAKRMREVLERRFGLKSGGRKTLEEIGDGYGITRERVRQIEADALRRLRIEAARDQHEFFGPIEAEIMRHGGVMAEQHLCEIAAPARFHSQVKFLLHIAPRFRFFPETDDLYARWALDSAAAEKGEEAIRRVVRDLGEKGAPVPRAVLGEMLISADSVAPEAYLRASKRILQNPYGEYGLRDWPEISPRGIRDKAHAALIKHTKPMHFRDVATAIDRAGWPQRRKTHAQTVHNELIKDNRFVLVGRGTYGLRAWGYEPGTVREVIVSLFKTSGRALDRDEVVRLATAQRMVKPQTVLLNLQDRDLFKRTDDGKYTLV